ncbi:MAG: hypothetical protein MUP58_00325 [Candidatus Nanohaloarchaeota archaeon QJJ-9]|nr:hypothetical protein [Candidatus Nanohaloarchaeota archaeon QJJ-9]
MTEKIIATSGRFAPFGNQHGSMVKYFAEEYGADQVYVITQDNHERTPKNPFTGEEKEKMIELAFKDYKTENYRVEPIIADNPFQKDALKRLGGSFTYFTREKKWKNIAETAKQLYKTSGIDIGVIYQPREVEKPYKKMREQGWEITLSSTEIRQKIVKDKRWEYDVSPSVRDYIKQLDKAIDAMKPLEEQEGEESNKHFKGVVNLLEP